MRERILQVLARRHAEPSVWLAASSIAGGVFVATGAWWCCSVAVVCLCVGVPRSALAVPAPSVCAEPPGRTAVAAEEQR